MKRVRGTRPAHVQENWCTQHEWTLKNHGEYTENPQIPHRVNKKKRENKKPEEKLYLNK